MAGFDICGTESSVSVLTDRKPHLDYTRFDIIGTSCYRLLDSIQLFFFIGARDRYSFTPSPQTQNNCYKNKYVPSVKI